MGREEWQRRRKREAEALLRGFLLFDGTRRRKQSGFRGDEAKQSDGKWIRGWWDLRRKIETKETEPRRDASAHPTPPQSHLANPSCLPSCGQAPSLCISTRSHSLSCLVSFVITIRPSTLTLSGENFLTYRAIASSSMATGGGATLSGKGQIESPPVVRKSKVAKEREGRKRKGSGGQTRRSRGGEITAKWRQEGIIFCGGVRG